jgi:hypothetical protein
VPSLCDCPDKLRVSLFSDCERCAQVGFRGLYVWSIVHWPKIMGKRFNRPSAMEARPAGVLNCTSEIAKGLSEGRQRPSQID